MADEKDTQPYTTMPKTAESLHLTYENRQSYSAQPERVTNFYDFVQFVQDITATAEEELKNVDKVIALGELDIHDKKVFDEISQKYEDLHSLVRALKYKLSRLQEGFVTDRSRRRAEKMTRHEFDKAIKVILETVDVLDQAYQDGLRIHHPEVVDIDDYRRETDGKNLAERSNYKYLRIVSQLVFLVSMAVAAYEGLRSVSSAEAGNDAGFTTQDQFVGQEGDDEGDSIYSHFSMAEWQAIAEIRARLEAQGYQPNAEVSAHFAKLILDGKSNVEGFTQLLGEINGHHLNPEVPTLIGVSVEPVLESAPVYDFQGNEVFLSERLNKELNIVPSHIWPFAITSLNLVPADLQERFTGRYWGEGDSRIPIFDAHGQDMIVISQKFNSTNEKELALVDVGAIQEVEAQPLQGPAAPVQEIASAVPATETRPNSFFGRFSNNLRNLITGKGRTTTAYQDGWMDRVGYASEAGTNGEGAIPPEQTFILDNTFSVSDQMIAAFALIFRQESLPPQIALGQMWVRENDDGTIDFYGRAELEAVANADDAADEDKALVQAIKDQATLLFEAGKLTTSERSNPNYNAIITIDQTEGGTNKVTIAFTQDRVVEGGQRAEKVLIVNSQGEIREMAININEENLSESEYEWIGYVDGVFAEELRALGIDVPEGTLAMAAVVDIDGALTVRRLLFVEGGKMITFVVTANEDSTIEEETDASVMVGTPTPPGVNAQGQISPLGGAVLDREPSAGGAPLFEASEEVSISSINIDSYPWMTRGDLAFAIENGNIRFNPGLGVLVDQQGRVIIPDAIPALPVGDIPDRGYSVIPKGQELEAISLTIRTSFEVTFSNQTTATFQIALNPNFAPDFIMTEVAIEELKAAILANEHKFIHLGGTNTLITFPSAVDEVGPDNTNVPINFRSGDNWSGFEIENIGNGFIHIEAFAFGPGVQQLGGLVNVFSDIFTILSDQRNVRQGFGKDSAERHLAISQNTTMANVLMDVFLPTESTTSEEAALAAVGFTVKGVND